MIDASEHAEGSVNHQDVDVSLYIHAACLHLFELLTYEGVELHQDIDYTNEYEIVLKVVLHPRWCTDFQLERARLICQSFESRLARDRLADHEPETRLELLVHQAFLRGVRDRGISALTCRLQEGPILSAQLDDKADEESRQELMAMMQNCGLREVQDGLSQGIPDDLLQRFGTHTLRDNEEVAPEQDMIKDLDHWLAKEEAYVNGKFSR